MDEGLVGLYRKALESGVRAASLSALDDRHSEAINESLSNFRTLNTRIETVGLFSDNEFFEELSTKDAAFLFAPYAYADVISRQRTASRTERMHAISEAEAQLGTFIERIKNYEILPESEVKMFTRAASGVSDPARRREAKIQQFQKQREIKEKLQALIERRDPQQKGVELPDNDLQLIAGLVSGSDANVKSAAPEDESEDDEVLRNLMNLLLRLCWAHAHASLADLASEREILHHAPPDPAEDRVDDRDKGGKEADETWYLDSFRRRGGGPDGKGPLLDPKGKPLRPFTITSNRAQMTKDVFRPDHRLPTMSIDEYLEEEMRRGNILTGGGAASAEKLTTDEQLQLDSEYDGTLAGEEAERARLKKSEEWAMFTEANPRGAGNTMNRG